MAELTVPQIDFSALGQLPKIYKDAQNEQTLANLGVGLSDGTLDYKQAAGLAARAGKLDTALSLMKLGEEKQQQSDFTKNFGSILGVGGSPVPQPAPMGAPRAAVEPSKPQVLPESQFNSIDAMADLKPNTQMNLPAAQGAVAGIESGGRYDAAGPAIASGPMAGQRGIGKYQVMESNVGPWTKEVLGRAMTPQEFAASPDAQDAVFNAKFGGYMDKYGAGGAARAWHAGEGGMNNAAARDQNGTSTAAYGDRVAAAVDDGTLPSNARLTGPAQSSGGAAQPSPRTNPVQNNIPALMYIMAHPGASAGQKKAAEIALTEAIKSPDNLKEYDFYQKQEASQGRQPLSLFDWTIKLKQAGATAITNDMRGENSFESEFGKKQADRWTKYMENGDAARKKMVDVNTMREISTRLGSQGAAAGVKEALGPYAEAVGVNLDGLSDIQAYTQVMQRLAPQQRAPGSGSTSDIEFKGFLKSLPGLAQNPAARETGLNTMEALARDDMSRGEIASRLATGEIKRAQAERELRELPDPMKGFVEWRKANPAVYGAALKGTPQPSAQPLPQQAAPKAPPQAGTIEQGFRFKGGDPSNKDNWEPAQ